MLTLLACSAVLAGKLLGGFTLAFPEYTLAPFSEVFGPFTANGKKALFLSCHQTLLLWRNDRSLFARTQRDCSLDGAQKEKSAEVRLALRCLSTSRFAAPIRNADRVSPRLAAGLSMRSRISSGSVTFTECIWGLPFSVVRHSNVRLGKILAFEQQWSPTVLGKRVSKTITEV
jgi:hypothetical protein